jgi:Ser/Thr protein kinase RdoA (MazF antagonist)
VYGRTVDATQLRDHLASAYSIEVTGTAALEDGVFRVDRAGRPPWVARAFRAGRPVARAEGDAAVLGMLEDAGIPAERCAHPTPVTEAGGRAVLVTTFVPGSPARHDDATRRALGDLLGQLHALPVPDGGPVARPAGSLHHDPRHEGGPAEDLASAAAHLAGVESRVPPAGRPAFEELRAGVAAADACDDLPVAVVHPDPVVKNAIATPDGPALVDWTGAGLGPRVTSLAVLLQSVAAGSGGDLGAVDPVVAGYRAHVALGPEELARLDPALAIRQLWLASWMFALTAGSGGVPTGREWWWPDTGFTRGVAARARAAFAAA